MEETISNNGFIPHRIFKMRRFTGACLLGVQQINLLLLLCSAVSSPCSGTYMCVVMLFCECIVLLSIATPVDSFAGYSLVFLWGDFSAIGFPALGFLRDNKVVFTVGGLLIRCSCSALGCRLASLFLGRGPIDLYTGFGL